MEGTLASFRRYVAKATEDDVRKINDEQIDAVDRRHLWGAVTAAELPDGIVYVVYNFR